MFRKIKPELVKIVVRSITMYSRKAWILMEQYKYLKSMEIVF